MYLHVLSSNTDASRQQNNDRYLHGQRAEANLEQIGEYIGHDNLPRALSFIRELNRCCMELAEMPEAWPVVPRHKPKDLRRRVHGRYPVFYHIDEGQISALRVLNDAMDFEATLFPEIMCPSAHPFARPQHA